jgi:hypothetical protein
MYATREVSSKSSLGNREMVDRPLLRQLHLVGLSLLNSEVKVNRNGNGQTSTLTLWAR